MKRLITLALALALAALAGWAQTAAVKSATIAPDIRNTGATVSPGGKMKISLAPAAACTLDAIEFGAYGRYSVSYWDSVKQGSDKDTTILQYKLQVANVNVAAAFSSYGMVDSFAFQDTNINHNAGWYCPRVYDMTAYIPWSNWVRGILLNLGPDTLRGFRIYQLGGVDF